MSSLAELVGELVRIDSVNPGLVAGAADEAEIARFVARWAEPEGAHADVEWVDLESTERCLEVYVAVARELCA